MKEREEYFDNIRIKKEKKRGNGKVDRKCESAFKDVEFKKSLGQNFISDKNLLNSIVRIAGVCSDDCVLEIGAGAGTLTRVIAENCKQLVSYEIDRSLVEGLNKIANECKNIEFRFQDFMQADLEDVYPNDKFKVVANIPYYITTPIIFKLLEISDRIELMLFMVQKEVALRFASSENCKEYGITSIILQSIADVKYEKTVVKECFTPRPKVDSALVSLKLNKAKFNIVDFDFFSKLVHNAFSMRRKTLINNLLKYYNVEKNTIVEILKNLGYSENVRPEEVSVENYVKLSNKMKNTKNILKK